MSERERFETWALTDDGNCNESDLKRGITVWDDEYVNSLVQRDWIVWQARATVAPAVDAQAPAGLTEREQFIWRLGHSAAQDCLRAAARREALEDAARRIEPRNEPDDWTEYARIRAEAAAAIRALSQKETGE
jgi:hypothetical protein